MGRFSFLAALLLGLFAFSTNTHAASILPPAKTCFDDANGKPVGGGTAGMFIPGTTTAKQTWQDSGQTILNMAPVPLDSGGCALIYGTGVYRQIVKDNLGNTVWDQLTADPGSGGSQWGGTAGGTGNAIVLPANGFTGQDGQIVTFRASATNTGPVTVTIGGMTYNVVQDGPSGPVPLTGGEIVAGNITTMVYSAVDGQFHLLNTQTSGSGQRASASAGGRLSLTLNEPVPITDVASTATVYFEPYHGDRIDIWNGSAIANYTFTQQTLNLDATATDVNYQKAGFNYDFFIIYDPTINDVRLCTGPAWASDTSRGTGVATTELGFQRGLLTNANPIQCRYDATAGALLNIATNQATFVGTMRAMTDGHTGIVMNPAAASGGAVAFVGYWNEYNRVKIQVDVIDNGASYQNTATTVVESRSQFGSVNNHIPFISGLAEDAVIAIHKMKVVTGNTAGDLCSVGVGFNPGSYNKFILGFVATNNAQNQPGKALDTALIVPQIGWRTLYGNENGFGTLAHACTMGGPSGEQPGVIELQESM